jgi:hypothetical protein
MGLFTSIALASLAIGSTVYSMSQANRQPTQAPALPQTPSIQEAEDKSKEAAKQKRLAMARSQTVYTSPLGLETEAEGARKTLLGQ